MKLCFLGTSHAAQHLSAAARARGFDLVYRDEADLVFVSEDTPTDKHGRRHLALIARLVEDALEGCAPVVLTSAVPPGFTRSLGAPVFHQAETLRIKDAAARAASPEMLIVGCRGADDSLPGCYEEYLSAWNCPVLKMTWEEAEFTKVAINAFLISQVRTTNLLAMLARKSGARWAPIRQALKHDARIGPKAYLTPGRWNDSPHLLRDFVTMCEIGGDSLLEAWKP